MRPEQRHADAAGLEDRVGHPLLERRRGHHRRRRARHLLLPEGPGAEVPAAPDPHGQHRRPARSTSRRTPCSRPRRYFPLRQAARIESFQPHMHLRGKAMTLEAILPSGQTVVLSHVGRLQLQLAQRLRLRRRCRAAAAEGHDHQDHGVARQHRREQGEPRSERLGRLRRPHRRRDGPRVGERHLPEEEDYLAEVEARRARLQESGRQQQPQLRITCARVDVASRCVAVAACVAHVRRRIAARCSCRRGAAAARAARRAAARPSFRRSKDGGRTRTARYVLLLGYYNRNRARTVDIPIGPTTASSRAVPTTASPRTSSPASSTACSPSGCRRTSGTKKLTWTLVANGQTSTVASGRTRPTGRLLQERRHRQRAAGDQVRPRRSRR